MGDQDPGTEPSLELPSFGFGRKRRAKKAAAPGPSSAGGPIAGSGRDSAAVPVVEPTPEPEPVVEPTPEPEPVSIIEPAEGPATGPVATSAAAKPRRRAKKQKPTRERRQLTLPVVPGPVAAVITGIVVGVLAVLLTGLSLRLCEAVKGTPACGAPGFLLLIAILILLTYVGGWMLRAWRISDPLSTSFLAVGLMAVVAMLFLVDVLFEWWMLIAIPVVAAATYALSWWVTASFVDVEE